MRADFEAYLSDGEVDGRPWTIERLLEWEDEAGVDAVVVMPNTQVEPDNTKLAVAVAALPENQRKRCLPCALIDPKQGTGAVDKLRKLVNDAGFTGLKLMAAVHKYNVDDEPLVRPLVEAASDLGIVVSIHSGPGFCHPNRIGTVAGWIPKTPVIMDHMGFPDNLREGIEQAKKYPNIYLGTTILRFHRRWGDDPNNVVPNEVQTAFDELGAERIVFGSNLPEYRPVQVMRALERLALSDEQKRLLFGDNLARVYAL